MSARRLDADETPRKTMELELVGLDRPGIERAAQDLLVEAYAVPHGGVRAGSPHSAPGESVPAVTAKELLAELKRRGSKKNVEGMARYAITAEKIFGVSVATIRQLAKQAGRSHDLANELWASGWYEARMLACFVDEPAKVTPAQLERWCKDFDSWALCDTACFHLFDRTPHAFRKVKQWAKRRPEFERRAAFALVASLAGHDRKAPEEAFRECLPLIEGAAGDGRNFVKKAVSWALRGIGHRTQGLHRDAVALAGKLSRSEVSTERWVGRDVLRDLLRPLVLNKVKARG